MKQGWIDERFNPGLGYRAPALLLTKNILIFLEASGLANCYFIVSAGPWIQPQSPNRQPPAARQGTTLLLLASGFAVQHTVTLSY